MFHQHTPKKIRRTINGDLNPPLPPLYSSMDLFMITAFNGYRKFISNWGCFLCSILITIYVSRFLGWNLINRALACGFYPLSCTLQWFVSLFLLIETIWLVQFLVFKMLESLNYYWFRIHVFLVRLEKVQEGEQLQYLKFYYYYYYWEFKKFGFNIFIIEIIIIMIIFFVFSHGGYQLCYYNLTNVLFIFIRILKTWKKKICLINK